MADLKLEFNDGVVGNSKMGAADEQPERRLYTVKAESGVFKNGQQYPQGSQVPLDEATAAKFIELGAVEAGQSQTQPQEPQNGQSIDG